MFCENYVIITYWLKQKDKKSSFWSVDLFENLLLLSMSKKFSSKTIFRWYTFGTFCKLNGRLNKVGKRFEIFLIDYYAGDIEKKNIAGKD